MKIQGSYVPHVQLPQGACMLAQQTQQISCAAAVLIPIPAQGARCCVEAVHGLNEKRERKRKERVKERDEEERRSTKKVRDQDSCLGKEKASEQKETIKK